MVAKSWIAPHGPATCYERCDLEKLVTAEVCRGTKPLNGTTHLAEYGQRPVL